MKTFEVRTEEEGIGNLLLVITNQDFASEEDALKSLWIEAQEYSKNTPLELIESDYLKESKSFALSHVSEEDFKSRLNGIFNLFDSYNHRLEEVPDRSFVQIKEQVMKSAVSKVLILEDDFTTYSVFVASNSSKALFSWCDVI